ncbi:EndoU domain-containing protein [Micromonospora sp. WMMD967]|uniref:EndoU domain-containing protein n=1 Tax=Micromonospora sp. WMMD967 TaxID=3016101 RepID=UPI002417A3D0|nr:EndoU domain-containing protein [Micromonospora sp. WMMD967]MDG4839960.1 EndoU domain-containing protein [Micromonospora sp. WMMD967]
MASAGRPGGGSGGGTGGGGAGRPPRSYGGINAANGISSAQQATGQARQQGHPPGVGQGSTTTPPRPARPPAPTTPPTAGDVHHSDASRKHILEGDGGRQGGHLAGTGFSNKTEFPKSWDEAKILDAAHRVTQQGPPNKGPYPTKDADGNPVWAYDYVGVVDGVQVKTTVLADGEIRTAYPPDKTNPGVISNPPAPNPAPQGIPMGNPPRYSNPDVGGDGSWTWEGPKGNKIIRVVQDDQGNVTRTELGDYKKK